MSQFIKIYENVFDEYSCQEAINLFEKEKSLNNCFNRQERENVDKTKKDDEFIFLTAEQNIFHTKFAVDFISQFKKFFNEYVNEFSVLQNNVLNIYTIKIQKTKIGGGYHIWHYESGQRNDANRVLAYTLYLNDVKEGGETEFLYQHLRIKAKTGSLCLFPAGFTHTHRGNPPLSNDKYIITGWVEY